MGGLGDVSGGIVVFIALSLTCLLGLLALTTDVKMLSFARRNAQTPAEFAIMPSPPLIVAVGKLAYRGIANVAIEARSTARAGGVNGVESLLAASPIRCIANFPVSVTTNYAVARCPGQPSWESEFAMKDQAKPGNDASRVGSSAVFPSRDRLRKATQALAHGAKRGVGR